MGINYGFDPTGATVSPDVHLAATNSQLTPEQTAQYNQVMQTLAVHKKLKAMPLDQAKKEFQGYGTEAQGALKYFYKDAAYMNKSPDLLHRAMGVAVNLAKAPASPFLASFSMLGKWGKVVGGAYEVRSKFLNGADIFNTKIWNDAVNGAKLFDDKRLEAAKQAFGPTDVAVAQGLLQNKNIGDIMTDLGYNDATKKSISSLLNDPVRWKQVKDAVSYAQISAGRDLAGTLTNPNKFYTPGKSFISGKQKNISGWADAFYSIIADPITWVTGGGTRAGSVSARMAQTFAENIKTRGMQPALETMFAEPKTIQFWDKFGPLMKTFNEGDDKTKAQVFETIRRKYPIAFNPDMIRLFAKAKVFDIQEARTFFNHSENARKLIGNPVDGMITYNTGALVAKREIGAVTALSNYMHNIFEGKDVAMTKGGLVKASPSEKAALHAISRPVEMVDQNTIANPDMKVINKIRGEMTMGQKIARLAERSPAGRPVSVDDEHVAETISNLGYRLRLLFPKGHTQFIMMDFLYNKTPGERVQVLKNLDSAILHNMGVSKHSKFLEMHDKMLAETYGGTNFMAGQNEMPITKSMRNEAPESAVRSEGGQDFLQSLAPIHGYQFSQTFGALDYKTVYQTINEIKSKTGLLQLMKYAFVSKHSANLMDIWSAATLLPRLGVRSAIDETLFFFLTAPVSDLAAFAARKGHAMGRRINQMTGSAEQTGPVRKQLLNFFGQFGQKKVNDFKLINTYERQMAESKFANEQMPPLDPTQLSPYQRALSIVDNLDTLWNRHFSEEEKYYFSRFLVHSPEMMNGYARSLVAASGLQGGVSKDIQRLVMDDQTLQRALESLQAEKTGVFKNWTSEALSQLNQSQYALLHYGVWLPRMVQQPLKFAGSKMEDGRVEKHVLDMFEIFMRNEALKEGVSVDGVPHITNAMREGMQALGFRWNVQENRYILRDEIAYKNFFYRLANTRHIAMQESGDTAETIARDYLFRGFQDMRTTFHGSSNGYNEHLVDAVKAARFRLNKMRQDASGDAAFVKSVRYAEGAATIDLKAFSELASNHHMTHLTTDISFEGMEESISALKTFGNHLFDAMDAQISAMYRQPAVSITALRLAKMYAPFEKEFVKEQIALMARAEPELWRKSPEIIRANAQLLADAKYSNHAIQDAGHIVAKFADNPTIRSNFSYAMRTVGRYYRATEDFQRRVYRLKDYKFRALFRARLLTMGITNAGFIHKDDKGQPYLILPGDSIIQHATDSTLRALTFDKGAYVEPKFNDLTLKLSMFNPSFQADAGVSLFSGPLSGMSIWAVQSILGNASLFVGEKLGADAKTASDKIGNMALGGFGDTMTLKRAIIPSALNHMWAMTPFVVGDASDSLNKHQGSQQEVTALQQALAINAFNGNGLSITATPEQHNAYRKDLQITTHNILILRHLLGLLAPVAPQGIETPLIPDYLKEAGYINLSSVFYSILNGVAQSAPAGTDIYTEALAIFTKDHPRRIVYNISKNTDDMRVVVRAVNGLQNWIYSNKSLISKYGETAFIFAPSMGQFNANSYNYLQASGMIQHKTVEQYYTDLMVAEDKQKYYDIADLERTALEKENNPYQRSIIIDEATNRRAALKIGNPLLANALKGDLGIEQKLMSKLVPLMQDPSANIPEVTRKRMGIAMGMVNNFVAYANSKESAQEPDFVQNKRDMKADIMSKLAILMEDDPVLVEANRAIFKGLLNFYSRDTYSAGLSSVGRSW